MCGLVDETKKWSQSSREDAPLKGCNSGRSSEGHVTPSRRPRQAKGCETVMLLDVPCETDQHGSMWGRRKEPGLGSRWLPALLRCTDLLLPTLLPCWLTLQHVSALSRAYSSDVATYETRVSPSSRCHRVPLA